MSARLCGCRVGLLSSSTPSRPTHTLLDKINPRTARTGVAGLVESGPRRRRPMQILLPTSVDLNHYHPVRVLRHALPLHLHVHPHAATLLRCHQLPPHLLQEMQLIQTQHRRPVAQTKPRQLPFTAPLPPRYRRDLRSRAPAVSRKPSAPSCVRRQQELVAEGPNPTAGVRRGAYVHRREKIRREELWEGRGSRAVDVWVAGEPSALSRERSPDGVGETKHIAHAAR